MPTVWALLAPLVATKASPQLHNVGIWKVAVDVLILAAEDFLGAVFLVGSVACDRFWAPTVAAVHEVVSLSGQLERVFPKQERTLVLQACEGLDLAALRLLFRILRCEGLPDEHAQTVLAALAAGVGTPGRPDLTRSVYAQLFALCVPGDGGWGPEDSVSSLPASVVAFPSGGGQIPTGLLPLLLDRAQQVLARFVIDERKSGNCPLPKHRVDELLVENAAQRAQLAKLTR